ncbi:MAG: hypothetical protein ABSF64_11405 [Bryobacteraceae bacterium]|jgi:hypothetical protein
MPLQIGPKSISLRARETQVFQASGAAGTVVWSIQPESGRIDPNGVYTAPVLVPRNTNVTVCAHYGTQFDTANITLDPGWFWLHLLGVYWLVWAAILLAVLLGRWDLLCPNCAPGAGSLNTLIAMAGALGGLVHGASSFAIFAGTRQFKSSWTWWYVLRPVLGAAVALIVYLVVHSGLGTGAPALSGADCLKTAGFAGLIGLFAEPATRKLKDVFDTVFTPREDPRRDKNVSP